MNDKSKRLLFYLVSTSLKQGQVLSDGGVAMPKYGYEINSRSRTRRARTLEPIVVHQLSVVDDSATSTS